MKVFSVLALLVLLTGYVGAQTSLLVGTVYDRNGAVVTSVKVKALDSHGTKFETVTDDEGGYELILPYSTNSADRFGSMKYVISFDKPEAGFEKKVISDFIFVSSTKGKMYLDCIIEGKYIEPIFHY